MPGVIGKVSVLPRRHSRESGNPLGSDAKVKMDSRFRGNDGMEDFGEPVP
jgi:hypothetical protein